METLRDIFRKAGQSVPQPIPIVCEDTAAHGIDKVLFKSLNHKAENKKGYFSVTLELWEYIPQTIRATKSSSGSASSSSTKKSGSTSGSLKPDYKSYLDSGRGSPPTASGSIGGYTNVTKSKKALTNKKNGSPAVDDADTSKVRSKLKSRQRST